MRCRKLVCDHFFSCRLSTGILRRFDRHVEHVGVARALSGWRVLVGMATCWA
jgi:hypothetical protein